jgi:predicted nucleic acid-binding protein
MITAVDTSVLLDVILDDAKYRDASLAALQSSRAAGALIVCPVVWAEVRATLLEPGTIGDVLGAAGVAFDPFDAACADAAGDLWRTYKRQGGKRTHLIPDFLIGAHAMIRTRRLLARDRGFFRGYFKQIAIIEPRSR